MTTFSQDIKSNIFLYSFTSSCFWSAMTRSGSISSVPVLCGCEHAASCTDSLLNWPTHWQPRRAYGQPTILKYTTTPATRSRQSQCRSTARECQHRDRVGTGWDDRWHALASTDMHISIEQWPFVDTRLTSLCTQLGGMAAQSVTANKWYHGSNDGRAVCRRHNNLISLHELVIHSTSTALTQEEISSLVKN